MARDPLYRDIERGLQEKIDGDLFEQCAADLLRQIYPGLVPVRGGGDAGMDGAISDGGDPPLPLVCTTEKNVLDNLRRSITSYLSEGGTRRAVVVATSQDLSPPRRRNMEAAAKQLGFTVRQIHAQDAFTDLLYHSPRWCRDLLGLTGDPPALSVYPLSRRPLASAPLVGREDDLRWLRETEGDLVLAGQPGSGKTFLFRELAFVDEGLFVIDRDMGRIAASLRAEQPPAVMVDDAHLDPEFLTRLRHLRTHLGAAFRILANTWPSEADAAATALGVGSAAIRQLEQLSRPEIAQVVEHCGIAGPDELIHEILNQAGGLPGLAVTLALLCLREGVREIVTAGSLFRNVRRSLESVVGERAVPILACFAVGGEAGMPADAVARALGMAIVDVRVAVARLAGGGVLVERFDGALAVIPLPLRHALVSTEFFEGRAALPIQPLLDAAPVFEQAVLTLIGAKSRRDSVPDPLLRELMTGARLDPELLESYARLGPDEAAWALVNGPQLIGYVAAAALDEIPDLAIPFLLTLSIGDDRPLHSTTSHPLRKIQDWAQAGEPGTPEAVGRRRQLLDALAKWSQGPLWDPVVGCRALAVAFSPVFEDMRADPVDGNRHTLRFGLLQPEEMVELQGFWPVAQEILGRVEEADWSSLEHLIHDWLYPRVRTRPDPATAVSMRDFAGGIAAETALRVGNEAGVHLRLARLAAEHGWTVDAPVDPRLEILFPERDLDEEEAAYAAKAAAARTFANELSSGDPGESAELLVRLHQQADRADLRGPDFSLLACNTIAAAVSDPGAWIAALLSAGASANFVEPFMERVVTDQPDGWEDAWRTCLESADRIDLRRIAAVVAIRNPQAPPSLVERAVAELPGAERHIDSACIRGEIPEDRVLLLLRHSSQAVAMAAAEGLWSAVPRGEIPALLSDDWRRVVVASLEDEYPLEAIFGRHPEIAWDWLIARLESPERLTFQVRRRLAPAVRALTPEQRGVLVERANGGLRLPYEVVRELDVQ
jgi:hypothetical protein